jgi:hypothetical protein
MHAGEQNPEFDRSGSYDLAHRPSLQAKTELKALVPKDAREAAGHGVRAKRSKLGAISFEVLELEASHATLQH